MKLFSQMTQMKRNLISLIYFIHFLPSITIACYNSSKEMYSCLHLFLERDFYLPQDLFNFEPRDFNKRFRLDQMELQQLCDKIKELENCYESQLPTCYTFPFHMNLLRIMNSLDGVHKILCSNGTDNLKELITHGYCIENYLKTNPNCNHEFEYRYPLVFLKIMRFEIGSNICLPLIKFRKCMIDQLVHHCDQNAMSIWNQSLETVVGGFCFRHQYINNSSPINFTNSFLILILIINLLINLIKKY